MLSVVIAARHPGCLAETVGSVLDQSDTDFEIVIAATAGAGVEAVLPADDRIRVVRYDGSSLGGGIRRHAFAAARGEVLVELEANDLLAPDTLRRVRGALDRTGADFAYSNFAETDLETGEAVLYDPYWGWASRPVEVRGRPLIETMAFDPSPAALAHACYAPQHLRAWTRDGYERAGGYDPALAVGEQHELAVRTYLSCRMTRIDECLYVRRSDAARRALAQGDDVQQSSHQVYERVVERLVARWAAQRGLPCFDLGSAEIGAPGWVTLDRDGARVVADLRRRWPWDDSTVGAFRAHDLLQYLPDKLHTMNEIHRCLAPGGWLLSSTPSALGQGAFMDPRHVSYWVRNSFYYWTDPAFARHIGNTRAWFQVQRLEESFPSDWHRAEQMPAVRFDGVCLKDGFDGPGPHQI